MLGKRLSQFWYSTLKKIIFKDVYQEIEKNAVPSHIRIKNKQKHFDIIKNISDQISEQISKKINYQYERVIKFADQFKMIQESADQISDIVKQNKIAYKEFQGWVKHSKRLNKDMINQFLITNNNQNNKFMKQISEHLRQKNNKLLEQISQNINQQLSTFREEISHKIDNQNSIFMAQNSKLTQEILDQSLKNHGTINEKFKELVMYQFLVTFRENLIIIKTTLVILERLDTSQLKIFRDLYLKFHTLHPEIPMLDVTRGILVIKILFPLFFVQMVKNLSSIKSQLDDDTITQITSTIKTCDSLFKNFSKSQLKDIKMNLNSDISAIDKIIAKLIDV